LCELCCRECFTYFGQFGEQTFEFDEIKASSRLTLWSVSENKISNIEILAVSRRLLDSTCVQANCAIVESPSDNWAELQQHRVNAAATADVFMNYTSVDRSKMVSHIIPVSGVSEKPCKIKSISEYKENLEQRIP